MPPIDYLMEKHGGKTVTFGTLLVTGMLYWGGASLGIAPLPATQEFVHREIAAATKGLDYLVRKELEEDLIAVQKEVCMGNASQEGVLLRLELEYFNLLGERYTRLTCSDALSRPDQ